MNFRSSVLALLAVLSAGCSVPSDLNTPCVLVRKDPADPTGKASLPLLEQEIAPNKDFLSFGSVECEDYVCVRDALFTRPGVEEGTAATGYCSRQCSLNSPLGCPSYDEALDKAPDTKLTCRALLLDVNTLAAIRQADPENYQRFFGTTETPYFCARGGDSQTQ